MIDILRYSDLLSLVTFSEIRSLKETADWLECSFDQISNCIRSLDDGDAEWFVGPLSDVVDEAA